MLNKTITYIIIFCLILLNGVSDILASNNSPDTLSRQSLHTIVSSNLPEIHKLALAVPEVFGLANGNIKIFEGYMDVLVKIISQRHHGIKIEFKCDKEPDLEGLYFIQINCEGKTASFGCDTGLKGINCIDGILSDVPVYLNKRGIKSEDIDINKLAMCIYKIQLSQGKITPGMFDKINIPGINLTDKNELMQLGMIGLGGMKRDTLQSKSDSYLKWANTINKYIVSASIFILVYMVVAFGLYIIFNHFFPTLVNLTFYEYFFGGPYLVDVSRNAIAGALSAVIGNYLSQVFAINFKGSQKNIDFSKVKRAVIYTVTFVTFIWSAWYGYFVGISTDWISYQLQIHQLPVINDIYIKVLLDQGPWTILIPYMTGFTLALHYIEGITWEESWKIMSNKKWRYLALTNWPFWIPPIFASFYFRPDALILITGGWGIIYSIIYNYTLLTKKEWNVWIDLYWRIVISPLTILRYIYMSIRLQNPSNLENLPLPCNTRLNESISKAG